MKTGVYRISDICSIKSGKRLPAGFDFSVEPTKYKYIRSRDIKAGKICLDEVAFIDEEIKKRINKYIISAGDVAITIVANIGDIGYATQDCDGINLTENAVRLTGFDKSIVFSKYLSYYMSQPSMKQYMENLAAGAAQAKLGIYKIEKIKVQLPDVSIQKAVVDIIEKYDDLIEVNNKRIKVLEQMAENLYKEWFVRFRFPGHETAEFENGIPKGWEYSLFAEVYNFVRGVSYSSEEIECDEGENLINLKNIQGFGGFRRDGTKKFNGQYKPEQIVRYKDLVMGVTDMTQDRRTVGAVALIPNVQGIISADLIKLTSSINNIFSYCLFRWGFYSTYISQFGNGANVIHLKPSTISNIKVLIPPKKAIDSFAKIVEPIMDQIETLYTNNSNLIKQRDLLLPRLMSGKLEVHA